MAKRKKGSRHIYVSKCSVQKQWGRPNPAPRRCRNHASWTSHPTCAGLVCVILFLIANSPASVGEDLEQSPQVFQHGVVAADHPAASEAGAITFAGEATSLM
ncbi:MAG TPA: hypothetical protein PK992_16915, partial [Planctomycetaceae bacterium]|nr:hypothetical protein [Planctomycetaceae bacterium]